jgi:transposase-like protein
MARPSTYQAKFCDQLVKHCEQGFSFESFAHRIGVSDRTLRNWRDQHSEFQEAYDRARTASLFFFEKLLIQSLTGKSKSSKLNPALLIFTLKTRFSAIYGQPIMAKAPTELIDKPGSFDFKGRRVTIAELNGDELREAAVHLENEIQQSLKMFEVLDSPNPFEKRRASF